MRILLGLACAAMAPLIAVAQADVSFVNDGIVDAPIAEVWKVFSTAEGYKVLGLPRVEFDLRVGGTIRSRYGTDGTLGDEETIETLILAYEPPRMIATRIQKTPKTFPFKEAWKKTWTVLTLTDLGNGRTHVRAASLGFGPDQEAVAMRRFFERGNQQQIDGVQKFFAERKGGTK